MRRDVNTAKTLLITGLVLLSTSPGFTQGKFYINLLLCGVMCISPLVLLVRGTRVLLPRIDVPLLLICLLVVAMPCIYHPGTVRWSTMLFTCAYCVMMMMMARLLRVSGLSASNLLATIRCIVYAFTAVLVVQQACLLMGWPIFCEGMPFPDKPYKLNALTAEPSHTSVVLAALMFYYTMTFRVEFPHTPLLKLMASRWSMWLCWCWTMFSTASSTALILAPMAFLPFVTRRNIGWTIVCAVAILSTVWFTPIRHLGPVQRVADTLCATASFDEDRIIAADESAAARIVPTFRGARHLFPLDEDSFHGHGVDAFISDYDAKPCDSWELGSAGIFNMHHNYGIFCMLALWWAIAVTTISPRRPYTLLAFLLAMQLSADYNMQYMWMVMAFGMVYKYAVCRETTLLATWPSTSQAATGRIAYARSFPAKRKKRSSKKRRR